MEKEVQMSDEERYMWWLQDAKFETDNENYRKEKCVRIGIDFMSMRPFYLNPEVFEEYIRYITTPEGSYILHTNYRNFLPKKIKQLAGEIPKMNSVVRMLSSGVKTLQ